MTLIAVPTTDIEDDAITLGWTALADVLHTGGEDITGYELNVWDGAKWVHEHTTDDADDHILRGRRPCAQYDLLLRRARTQQHWRRPLV